MRCRRCGKGNGESFDVGVHTCTPFYYYKGITGVATLPNKEAFNFVVEKVNLNDEGALELKVTSGENKGKYSVIYAHEIDGSLKFNI